MKNSKKWIALGLSLMMLGGLVACGNEESSTQPSESSAQNQSTSESETQEAVKDPVTLEWWYSGNGIQKDTELVEEEFNKLLQTYPGMEHVTVNFNCIVEADYGSQVSLAQSAEQKMDILQTYNLVFANEVANGTFLPLNNYLDEYPNLKNELPDWLWNFGTVDGNIYIVPNYQRASNQMYLITPKVYMDKYGDYEKLSKVLGDNNKTIEAVAEVIEEYYLAVRDGESGTKYMYPISHYWRTPWGYGLRGDNLGTNRFVLPSDSDEVIYRYTSEEMLKGYEISAEWYAKGYVHPDYLTVDQNDFVETNMLNEVSWIYYCGNGAGSAEVVSAQYSEKCGFEVVAIPLYSNYYIGNSWAAGGNGVTAKCENPEEAVRLLELLNTEEGVELYNMVVYGLEGVHYKKIDDTHIETLEYDGTQGGMDTSYAAMKWKMGNTVYAYLNQGCAENENEIAREINENKDNEVSKLTGFIVDTSSIGDKMSQIDAIHTEYTKTIQSGVLKDGWKAHFDEYEKKLKDAGLEDVLTEMQRQVDEFLAK